MSLTLTLQSLLDLSISKDLSIAKTWSKGRGEQNAPALNQAQQKTRPLR